MLQRVSNANPGVLGRGARWGCLKALPSTEDGGEALVSLGAEQWLRLPLTGSDIERHHLRLGQCVAVDTTVTPMRLVAVRS